MREIIRLVALVALMMLEGVAPSFAQVGQGKVWVRIEAQDTLNDGKDAAAGYARRLANVQGYALKDGWYGIVLGPFSEEEAALRLRTLRRQGQIPRDSFLVDGANFGAQYWPVGAASAAAPAPDATPDVDARAAASPAPAAASATAATAAAAAATDTTPAPLPDESPAEARRSEAQLTRAQREELQEALKWQGFYSGRIDGAFGRGTRGSMADWQATRGYEATGILTTAQRATLLGAYHKERAALGLTTITDDKAGIEITLPMAMLDSPRYDPPFAHYPEKDGSGVQVLLISQPGNAASLAGLYKVLQTLRVVPMTGPRQLDRRSFEIRATNDEVSSYTYAALKDGLIKGYMLVWNTSDTARMDRVLSAMKQGFRPVGKHALDPASVPTPAVQRRALVSGLEQRKPAAVRSGFYVDDKGTVLTTDAVLKSCARITVGAGHDATLAHEDKALGLAILTPKATLSPLAVARFDMAEPRLADPVAVAGYSYGGKLSAPVMTYGTLEGLTGLQGEPGLRRLALAALPGDAGGPVFDQGGAVVGMLLPRPGDDEEGKVLPGSVRFAASAAEVVAALKSAGVTPRTSRQSSVMAPEDLATLGADMAVLVRCWK